MLELAEPRVGEPGIFLKWAGSKRRLAQTLAGRMPQTYGRYFEPFLGAGALFFTARPKNAVLSDINSELINCYQTVQHHLDELLADLERHANTLDYFSRTRSLDPAELSPIQRASRFIYLNRTCYNGLYRVNRRGQFNTPFGRYKAPLLVPRAALTRAAAALQDAQLLEADFRIVTRNCAAGDFVYLDPPYVPVARFSDFRRYDSSGFSHTEHVALRDLFGELAARGVFVMLSNSDSPAVRQLYAEWKLHEVTTSRSINSLGSGRGPIGELLITSY